MTLYIIKECQQINSDRQGYEFTGNLTDAKTVARHNKAYNGTCLKIETPSGTLVAIKETGQGWRDVH